MGLALVTSCRSCISLLDRIGLAGMAKSAAFRAYYARHGAYWFFFGALVLSHLLMGTIHTGLPQAGDPDAPVHWWILLVGLGSAVTAGVSFASCRILPRFLVGSAILRTGAYRRFLKYHGYLWWVFLGGAGAHFAIAFLHAGVWPPISG